MVAVSCHPGVLCVVVVAVFRLWITYQKVEERKEFEYILARSESYRG